VVQDVGEWEYNESREIFKLKLKWRREGFLWEDELE